MKEPRDFARRISQFTIPGGIFAIATAVLQGSGTEEQTVAAGRSMGDVDRSVSTAKR